MIALHLFLLSIATAMALALRPWRGLGADGPPAAWGLWCALMPLLWSLDRVTQAPLIQPLSGAAMLVLFAGWPLAVLALWPVALAAWWLGGLPPAEALHRAVWLGVAPATLMLVLNAGLRRWLPRHLFVFILGRGFFATMIAATVASAGAIALHASPVGTDDADLLLAHLLAASGEAFLTGMLVAIGVAFHPHWLATYPDRLYLPARPPG